MCGGSEGKTFKKISLKRKDIHLQAGIRTRWEGTFYEENAYVKKSDKKKQMRS